MSLRRRRKFGNQKNSNWLLTYSDMLTLLLVFFLLLIGMKNSADIIEENSKINFFLSIFNKNIGLLVGGHTLTDDYFQSMSANIEALPSETQQNNLKNIYDKANELFKIFIKSKRVRVENNSKGISILLLSDFFFKPNSAQFDALKNREILEKLKLFLNYLYVNHSNYRVEIQGHSDSQELKWPKPKLNINPLELSFFRAQSVLKSLKKNDENRDKSWGKNNISLHAFGNIQPLSQVGTPEERAFDRRVAIHCIWE